MHLLRVFYYYYCLFYVKVIKDPAPFFTTVLTLSFSLSLFINGVVEIIAIKFFCYDVKMWSQILILCIIIFLNYLLFYRNEKCVQIIKSKPNIANSKTLSASITIIFFLISISWLFWGPIYGKELLNQCK